MEKHELSKVDFELIEDAFKALLQSRADPVTADKIADLRDRFRDAFTGWLEIDELPDWQSATRKNIACQATSGSAGGCVKAP